VKETMSGPAQANMAYQFRYEEALYGRMHG